MNERLPRTHTHTELLSREHALHRAQAAGEIGGIAVSILRNEGETYTSDESRYGIVPKGDVQIRVSSTKDTSQFYRRSRQLDSLSSQDQRAA